MPQGMGHRLDDRTRSRKRRRVHHARRTLPEPQPNKSRRLRGHQFDLPNFVSARISVPMAGSPAGQRGPGRGSAGGAVELGELAVVRARAWGVPRWSTPTINEPSAAAGGDTVSDGTTGAAMRRQRRTSQRGVIEQSTLGDGICEIAGVDQPARPGPRRRARPGPRRARWRARTRPGPATARCCHDRRPPASSRGRRIRGCFRYVSNGYKNPAASL